MSSASNRPCQTPRPATPNAAPHVGIPETHHRITGAPHESEKDGFSDLTSSSNSVIDVMVSPAPCLRGVRPFLTLSHTTSIPRLIGITTPRNGLWWTEALRDDDTEF